MNTRIKEVRETLKNENGKKYTQTQFAEAMHVTRDMIATFESGKVTPTPLFISTLCDKYNVNENWLRTGKGNMFKPNREREMSILSKRILKADEDDYIAKLIKNLAVLDIEDWKELNRIIKKLLKDQEKDSSVN